MGNINSFRIIMLKATPKITTVTLHFIMNRCEPVWCNHISKLGLKDKLHSSARFCVCSFRTLGMP